MNMNRKTLKEIARNYQGRERIPIQTILLRLLYASGTLSVLLVAPNLIQVLRFIDPTFEKDTRAHRRVSQALARLRQQKLIADEQGTISLTDKGETKIEEILSGEYRIPEPILWDGKWRILMFDIPERKRKMREMLRVMLARTGFLRLQDSVWIYPYSCDEFLGLVRAHLKSVKGELIYLTADFFESDKALRSHFGIS
jgi:DNA-binding transcriptional regulator PaaX